MLDAEDKPEENDAWAIPTRAERQYADFNNRLIDDSHLELFLSWWTFGGMRNPPTVTELSQWPAALLHDFMYIMRRMGQLRSRKEK